jgi:hypothetical protein
MTLQMNGIWDLSIVLYCKAAEFSLFCSRTPDVISLQLCVAKVGGV